MKFPRFLQISVDFSQILAFPATQALRRVPGVRPGRFLCQTAKISIAYPTRIQGFVMLSRGKVEKTAKNSLFDQFLMVWKGESSFGSFRGVSDHFWVNFESISDPFFDGMEGKI